MLLVLFFLHLVFRGWGIFMQHLLLVFPVCGTCFRSKSSLIHCFVCCQNQIWWNRRSGCHATPRGSTVICAWRELPFDGTSFQSSKSSIVLFIISVEDVSSRFEGPFLKMAISSVSFDAMPSCSWSLPPMFSLAACCLSWCPVLESRFRHKLMWLICLMQRKNLEAWIDTAKYHSTTWTCFHTFLP